MTGPPHNRSVPADSVLPHLVYRDVPAAIEWLSKAFGFREHYRHGHPVSGAQLSLGGAWIMLKAVSPGSASPVQLGGRTQSLTIFVEDPDAHFTRAKAAGARICEEPHDTVYGERQYAAEDLEGHRWLFSRHVRDVNPADWGASVAHPL